MILYCAVHGRMGRVAKCDTARCARRAWQRAKKRGKARIITSTEANDPDHTAVCADDGRGPDDKEHERIVMRCLKSSIRSGKLKRTRELKQSASPRVGGTQGP